MKQIIVTSSRQTLTVLVDDEDFDELNAYRWHPSYSPYTDYVSARVPDERYGDCRTRSMHNFLMKCPRGMVVDHIDGNGLNNQKANLRIVTQSQNVQRSRLKYDQKHEYKGISVYVGKKRMRVSAAIQHNGVRYALGAFDNKEDAAKAYDRKARELYGEHAFTNFQLTPGTTPSED